MFYRTTYTVQVLSPEPIPSDMAFPDVVREGIVGAYVLDVKEHGPMEVLTRAKMQRALTRAGSYPEFFDLSEYNEHHRSGR